MAQLQAEFGKHSRKPISAEMIAFKELYNLWLVQYRLKVKPSTVATSKRFIEGYALEYFGSLRLDKITVRYCQKIVNKWHGKYKQYHYFRKVVGQVLQLDVQLELLGSGSLTM
ncbi:N-terminal phage integrase SAM-like domain-containing protein [Enterococcus hirae]|nr:N-terminal phage integrase SAM-like domain-containing protein [Enterococcus hirae]